MARFTCDEARDYLDSAKAELDLLKQNIELYIEDGSDEMLEKLKIRRHFLLETVDELMEGLRMCKFEQAVEILGEDHVFAWMGPYHYVPFSKKQLEKIRALNEADDQRRQTNLVQFADADVQSVLDKVHFDRSKLNNALGQTQAKVSLPPIIKGGWRLIQNDVFPQSAGASGDGIELYAHQLELMRRFEKEKKMTEHSVRHATPAEIMFFLFLKSLDNRKKPFFNQRGYNLLTDIQSDDGGMVLMEANERDESSAVSLDLIARHSKFARVGCIAVIDPDNEAKPPKKMLNVSGF